MAKKTAPKKSVKRTLSKKSASQSPVISYQRIVIITSCVVLAVVGLVLFNKPAVTQSVAGVSVAKGLFSQATIDLPVIDGAVSYNIYYKKGNDTSYDHAVRNIPVDVGTYTISHLTKGEEYDHRIVAVDESGKEFWFSPTRPILDIQPME